MDSNHNAHYSDSGEIVPCLVTHGTLVDIVTQTVATAKEHLVIQGESVVFTNGDDSLVKDYVCCILPTINTLTQSKDARTCINARDGNSQVSYVFSS